MLGDIKTAVAKNPGSTQAVYEVVYVELIDPLKPATGKAREKFNITTQNKLTANSVKIENYDAYSPSNKDFERFRPISNTITADSNAIKISQTQDIVKYISNIDNMRRKIKQVGLNSRDFLPLWMRTAQEGSLSELDYVLALPIVYTKPGYSTTIKENILNSGFDFKKIDFEIDRYIIDSTAESSEEQFVLFANYRFNI